MVDEFWGTALEGHIDLQHEQATYNEGPPGTSLPSSDIPFHEMP